MSEKMEPKGQVFKAVLLGFLVIPAGVVFVPNFWLSREIFDWKIGDLLVGLPFGYGAKGFLVASALIYFLLFVKMVIPAGVSWLVFRSKKLAGITFVSAICIQIVFAFAVRPIMLEPAVRARFYAEQRAEQEFHERVSVGEVTYRLEKPISYNPYPQYGQMYAELHVVIPLTVRFDGEYLVRAAYQGGASGRNGAKEITASWQMGEQALTVVFTPQDLPHDPSYWFFDRTKTSRSTVSIAVFQITSEQDIYGKYRGDSVAPQKWEVAKREFSFSDFSAVPVSRK